MCGCHLLNSSCYGSFLFYVRSIVFTSLAIEPEFQIWALGLTSGAEPTSCKIFLFIDLNFHIKKLGGQVNFYIHIRNNYFIFLTMKLNL